jgi:hypothetical protein
VIESVFANLKEQMRLERHRARTPAGLAVRIAQRILALTLGMLLNTLSGRPRAPSPPTTADESSEPLVVAYDEDPDDRRFAAKQLGRGCER